MLITLAPRAVLGYRRAVLNSDAVFFVETAIALERGDTDTALEKLGLNVYPFLLAGLHQLGLSWETGGAFSSLAFSALTVLPLLAWVTRLFGRRTAICACLLWACHVEAVEWGPIVIRDAMFWFEVNLSLWLSLEAARRGTFLWYAATWLVVALAFLTRIEGALLVMPLAWWSVALVARTDWRPRLVRLSLCSLMVPLVVVAINVTLLRHHDRWEWGRLAYSRIIYHWVTSPWGANDVTDNAVVAQAPTRDATRYATSRAGLTKVTSEMSLRAMFWGFRHTLFWGIGPVYVALIAIALARFGWLTRWREQTPLFLFAGALLACIWIYLWYYHDTTKRYAVTVLIPLLPLAAEGLATVTALIARLINTSWTRLEAWAGKPPMAPARSATAGLPSSVRRPRIASACYAVSLAAMVSVMMFVAVGKYYNAREYRAELGNWIAERYGRGRTILCTEDVERLVGYHAGAMHHKIPKEVTGEGIGRWVDRIRPELVVLWLHSPGEDAYTEFLATANEHGYAAVDNRDVPQDLGAVRVFVRRGERLASHSK